MHVDQTTLGEDRCRRKGRLEQSKAGTCHRTQSRRSYPRNKGSTVATGRSPSCVTARQAATRRFLRRIIVHAAPSQWNIGKITPVFPATSRCLSLHQTEDCPRLPKA